MPARKLIHQNFLLSKSKIFLYFCLSFILGIASAPYFKFSLLGKLVLLLLATILIFIFWRSRLVVVFSLCFVFFVFGLWRYELAEHKVNEQDLSYYNDGEEILFEGVVTEEPDVRTSQTKLTVAAKKLYLLSQAEKKEIKNNLGKIIFYEDLAYLPQKEISGKALLNLPRYLQYNCGDKILVLGKMVTPKSFSNSNFSYEEYLSRYQIYSLSYYPKIILIGHNKSNKCLVFEIKRYFEKGINQILPEPYAAFLAGLLFGAKKAIPEELLEKFNHVGLTHILVVSGYNISIIASVIAALFLKFFSRKMSFWFSVLAIFLFVVLVGAQAPVVRAGIMGILVLLAKNTGRLSNITNSLSFVAAVMILINPKILAFDLGFQLSFLATCGIVYFSPYLEKFLKWLPEFFEIRETAKTTISAQILVLPKILLGFLKISFVSILVNILILPIIPITMFFGFMAGLFGPILPFLGKIFGYFAYSFLNYEIIVVEFFDKLLPYIPFGFIQFQRAEKWWVWAYFFGVAVVYFYVKWKKEKSSKVS